MNTQVDPNPLSHTHECHADSPTDDRATVAIIEDDGSVRAALVDLFNSLGMDAVCFETARQYQSSTLPDGPTCLILDVRIPGLSGIEFQRQLHQAGSEIPIIFITAHGDISMSVAAMKLGAVEFLTKPFRDQDLIDAVLLALDRDAARRKQAAELQALRDRYERLSAREREVLCRVVEGITNKDIATELGISEITVKVHRGQAMAKMQASSLPALVRMADKLTQSS